MHQRARPTLRDKALAWLARREHSRHELRLKLRRWVEATQAVEDAGAAPGAAQAAVAGGAGTADAESREAAARAAGIEPLLDALQAAGHLSDERFAESRVRARRQRFGNLRIEKELKSLGAAASETLRAELRTSEPERARRVWSARFAALPSDAHERARQMRFLAARGFSIEVIRKVLSGTDIEG